MMSLILFTLAVELDYVFRSRGLSKQVHKLGFCESHDEVLKFKQTFVTNESIDDLPENDEGFTTGTKMKSYHATDLKFESKQ